MEKIGIFCSAAANIDKMYFESARQIGEWMGKTGKTLIYGGADLGLMECVARAVKENGGKVIGTIYDRSALDQKDKYTVFFGGNYPRVDVYTTAETGKTLLLFKDSYANCLMQFLYPYYDHIILIDPRYYYDNVESVISREQVTDVLFLYNANTYFEDTSLADVLNVSEN